MKDGNPRILLIRALEKGDLRGWDAEPRDASGAVRHRLDLGGGLEAVAVVRRGGRCFAFRRRFRFSFALNGLRDVTPSYRSIQLTGPYKSLRMTVPPRAIDLCGGWPLAINGQDWFSGVESLPAGPADDGWDGRELRRLARLVRFGDMSVLDGGRRFVLRSDLTLSVAGSFESRTPEDLVMDVDHHPKSLTAMTLRGIPSPTADDVAVTMGPSSFEIALGRRMMRELSEEYGIGTEATRRYLAEHPVSGVPEGLGGAPPSSGPEVLGRGPSCHITDVGLAGILKAAGLKRSLLWGDAYDSAEWSLRPPANPPADPLRAQSERAAPNLLFRPTGFEMSWTGEDLSDAAMNMPLGDREVAHILRLFARDRREHE